MFCSSLRSRSEWSTVPRTLLTSKQSNWQERALQTHDICILVPRASIRDQQKCFLLLLLSQTDLETPGRSIDRIQRLHHQGGGEQIGIVFLLNEKTSSGNGLVAIMKLQISLQGAFEMPIIPLYSISSLQPALLGFQRQLVSARSSRLSANPYTALLPYCSNNAPIAERSLNVLNELCCSIPELSQMVTSKDGQQALRDMLPESALAGQTATQTAEDIIEFWQQEIIVD